MKQAGEVDYLITWRDDEFAGRVSLTPCVVVRVRAIQTKPTSVRDTLRKPLDDLDRVAVGVSDPCDQQAIEPSVWCYQARGSLRGELGVGTSGVVCPEDHRGTLALGHRVEPVIIAGGRDRCDTDLVAIELEVDMDWLTLGRHPEGLRKPETGVELGRTSDVLAEQDDLRISKHGHESTP
jgi:hypothetical protein